MSDERPPSVLGGLPRSRPHRRSDKRPAVPLAADKTAAPEASRAAAAVAPETRTAVAPQAGSAVAPKARSAVAPETRTAVAPETRTAVAPEASAVDTGPLGTAVQAAAEIAEIGLKAGARALRGALSRLPRP